MGRVQPKPIPSTARQIICSSFIPPVLSSFKAGKDTQPNNKNLKYIIFKWPIYPISLLVSPNKPVMREKKSHQSKRLTARRGHGNDLAGGREREREQIKGFGRWEILISLFIMLIFFYSKGKSLLPQVVNSPDKPRIWTFKTSPRHYYCSRNKKTLLESNEWKLRFSHQWFVGPVKTKDTLNPKRNCVFFF